jgi:hypothetical protein
MCLDGDDMVEGDVDDLGSKLNRLWYGNAGWKKAVEE